MKNNVVLFLCTGNYYRSRFAEIYFNYLADEYNLSWSADSRGLSVELGHYNIGPISPFALQKLAELNVNVPQPQRESLQVNATDLEKADLIVAMYDDEHRPFVKQKFPLWLERIEFWKVPDIDITLPKIALATIQKQVEDLVNRLKIEKATNNL
jgi:protein-tyrosine phosphatase